VTCQRITAHSQCTQTGSKLHIALTAAISAADVRTNFCTRLCMSILVKTCIHQADPSYLDDPHLRMAFASKLDAKSHEIQDKSIVLQTFYEGRIAALDRCVFK
jgi:hypothetical protein